MRVVDIKNLDLSILPTKYDEQYRSFDIYKYFEKEYSFENNKNIEVSKYKYLENKNFYNIYFINGNINLNGLDKLFELGSSNKFESINSLYLLNKYLRTTTIKLSIKEKLDKPLNIINIFEGEKKFHAQTLHIIFKNNCSLVETFHAEDLKDSFININREYELCKNTVVDISKIQTLNNASLITNYRTNIGENSFLKLVNLEYKADLSLNIFDSQLKLENASLEIEGVCKIKNNQKAGNIAFIEHFEKNTKSDIKIKHLLDETSHALFDVTSKVNNSAIFSKAFQNSQTILLSDDARINANPRLEIYVDELEASHGASSGTLNEAELYYLCSRGISKEKAKEMIIDSIELKIINGIQTEDIKKYIHDIKRINHV